MGGVGLMIAGQQVGSLLDTEYDKIITDSNLGAAAAAVRSQVNQGFDVNTVAFASLLLPIFYGVLKMMQMSHAQKIAERAAKLERETKEHDVELDLKRAREMALIAAGAATRQASASSSA